jgi:hypothetical protein
VTAAVCEVGAGESLKEVDDMADEGLGDDAAFVDSGQRGISPRRPWVNRLGQLIFAAMRDVRAGEELTYDWAMEENIPARTECRCGAPTCRKILTGRDWTKPVLRRKYRRYLSA